MHGLFTNLSSNLLHNMIIKLDYHPLFGKMSPHSPSPRIVVKSKKNILEIEKKVFSRTTCASSQPASCQCFPAISHIQTGERKRLEYQVRCSVINVEENLATVKHSENFFFDFQNILFGFHDDSWTVNCFRVL